MLQSKTKLTAAMQEHIFQTRVQCGDESSPSCSGNQCCPGTAASDFKTYPCPNADPDWNQCQTQCVCSGNQCCPGTFASDFKTYPCPSADPDWNQCEGTLQAADESAMLQSKTKLTAAGRQHMFQ